MSRARFSPDEQSKRPRQSPWEDGGEVRFMAGADGYVMVRRPGCMPFILTAKAWADLPLFKSSK